MFDLTQIPYDYTVEVTNRFKGLDLIDRVPLSGHPRDLEGCRVTVRTLVRLLTHHSGFFLFSFFDGDMGWSVCMGEVSNYGLSCC